MNATRKCSIVDCDRSVSKRGWCGKHYKRWYKYGDPTFCHFERFTDRDDVFKAKTKRVGECLEWTGLKNATGYGRMWDGEKVTLSHRFAWAAQNGPIPEEMVIDHACHNPACVRIEHLRAVTQKRNMQNRRGAQKNNALGVRGVHWDKERRAYVAQVMKNRKSHHVGRFSTLEEAEAAAIAKRRELDFLGEAA